MTEKQLGPLVADLPDPEGARRFFQRFSAEHAREVRALLRDAGLLSDLLALAAWSPLLATTLLQHPEYVAWLARERLDVRVKTVEELSEELARFAFTRSQLDRHVLLARFRRRELLRIYLRDVRRTSDIVEITEEISNLADAVLLYALEQARFEMEKLHGTPLCTDERGRKRPASFVIVALGKLGSRELNYASDIDLVFLYSDEGETSGTGTRGAVTNREYFNRLAERILQLVGRAAGEGAAYRVDLRLRPYGRDGALGCSLSEAIRYYREKAHPWELQALIRARAAAGDASLYARFAEAVRARVYRTDETVDRALAHVRTAKQKIDRQHAREGNGFNVKLGRGGIREIEFIAQALQLAYGGRDAWLQAPHTLISLGRLADRGLITERERSSLSEAYLFLRMLEHRLQMEHGLQTHTVPEEVSRRELVARRMHFTGPDALARFDAALAEHTTNVHAAFKRVFNLQDDDGAARRVADARSPEPERSLTSATDPETKTLLFSAPIFAARLEEATHEEEVLCWLRDWSAASSNPRRALANIERVAASLAKFEGGVACDRKAIEELARLCGVSDVLSELIASNPSLIEATATPREAVLRRDHYALQRFAVHAESSWGGELSALRRTWARLLVEIGARDAAGELSLVESNRLQTSLAEASLANGLFVACREAKRRYGRLQAPPRLAIFGLGRLGSRGMDYGSDLDVVLVYDAASRSPVEALAADEAYVRLAEALVVALSSMTRDGYLYRVDMRLRPDGKKGALVVSDRAFIEYLRERASVWEWLAYVKLRAVAGDTEFGRRLEEAARRTIHESARRTEAAALREQARRIRERLEQERAERGVDIKFGRGGMLDVYFVVRFLQLRDDVRDQGDDRSTLRTIERLREAGALEESDAVALRRGYDLLRRLDHHLRLIVGRSTRLPTAGHPTLEDLARRLRFASANCLTDAIVSHMEAIRALYQRIIAS
ncbi:MAG: hypothetical protein C4334_08710 [Pyrinomonas sp.]|uniref:[protein-PII] uridylyltransferase family protein n=1 Tax=Pyrinomonas sp. TaxID=2080306 RepID=UPI003328C052